MGSIFPEYQEFKTMTTNNKLILPCDVSTLMVGEEQNILLLPRPVGEVSDGDHSFEDLYNHRNLLFLAFLNLVNNAWYSEKHHDGSSFEGWFIAGVELNEGEQITYHLPNKYLGFCSLNLNLLDRAPEWDGHKSEDVLSRIEYWIESGCKLIPRE